MTIYHFIVLGSVLLASLSQMLLKKGASVPHAGIITEYLNMWVVAGYSLMLCCVVIDVWAIANGVCVKEVSTIESASYLFVPVLGALLFKEKISLRKALSIALILAGVVVFFL